jgi:hypothetical protein
MKRLRPLVSLAVVSSCVASCGEAPEDRALNVTWSFLSGDCASNAVKTVRVTWGPSGAVTQKADFECAAGQGKLGELSSEGGSYGITAEGLDAAGVARFTHFGTTLNVGSAGTLGQAVDLTLRPKPAAVIVTWRMSNGGGCPPAVQLPYFIAIYRPPAMAGGALTDKVKEVQESCVSRTATLEDVTPGDYVVELDTRAITPKVRGTQQVTVRGGENAMVDFQF